MSVWYLLMSSMIFGLARRSFSWVKKWANLMNSTKLICNNLQRSPSGLLSAGHPLLHTIATPLGGPPEPNPASFPLHSQVPPPIIPLNLFSNVPRSTYKFLPYQSLSHLRRRVPVVGQAGEGRPHSSRCCSRESSRHLELVMAIIVHWGHHNFVNQCNVVFFENLNYDHLQ